MSTPRDRIEARLGLTGPPLQAVRGVPPAIPDHELVRRIGQGAYGEVWLARNALGTPRAVKIVYRDNFRDDRPYEREFAGIRRFEPLSRSNEGFVDVLQVGRDDAQGYFYYVMELADSAEVRDQKSDVGESNRGDLTPDLPPVTSAYVPRTLARDLALRGRLTLEDCLQLGLTLTLALGHLHRHGLIHRDVKPSNIIYVGGVPKLADIGLVTEAQGANTFVGTEGFVPPEGPTSPQADLYALGKVLYEAAMGKDRHEFPEPFTQIGTDQESIALMELNAVLLRACAPEPKKRYASAEEMHADLALLHSGGSVKRRHQFDRQFQIAKRVGAVAIVATLAIGAAWLWQRQETQKMTRLAEEKSTLATEKTRLADNLNKLGVENRNRIVRLDIANGVRLLDVGDPAGALLWFADALPRLSNNPSEEAIHRIRIQQTIDQQPRLLQLLEHESAVVSSDFSPDGRYVATGTMEGRVRVWDTATATTLWPPLDTGMPTLQVRFTSDGRLLYASDSPRLECSFQGSPPKNYAAVMDVKTGQEVFPRLSENLGWSTMSRDGRWIAAAYADHVVRLYETDTGRLVTELRGHTNAIIRMCFNGDGTLLASGSHDGTARVWLLPSGEAAAPPMQHDRPVRRLALSEDGRLLVTSIDARSPGGDCLIQLWDVASGRKLGDPFKEPDRINALFFDPLHRNRLFVAGAGSRLRVLDLEAHVEVQPALDLGSAEACYSLSQDGTLLALGCEEHKALIRDLSSSNWVCGPLQHPAWVMSVSFSQDKARFLTGGGEGAARLWSLRPISAPVRHHLDSPIVEEFPNKTTKGLGRVAGPIPILTIDGSLRLLDTEGLEERQRLIPKTTAPGPNRCVISPNGHVWASFREDPESARTTETVNLWSEREGNVHYYELIHPASVTAAAFSPDGSTLLTGASDGQVRCWRTRDGMLEKAVPLPEPTATVSTFSADARRALVIRAKTTVSRSSTLLVVLDLESAKPLGPSFECRAGMDFSFDRTGDRVAAVSQDTLVRIFNAHTGQMACPPFKQPGMLSWVEWSPDGRQVLAAGESPEVILSDATTGEQLLAPMRTGKGYTGAARWSADGRFIVTRSDDGFVRVWDALTAEAVTPLIPHSGYVRFAVATPDGHLVSASDPDLVQSWNLRQFPFSQEVLRDYAMFLSGRRLSDQGVMLALKPQELSSLGRSLRSRAPELFQ